MVLSAPFAVALAAARRLMARRVPRARVLRARVVLAALTAALIPPATTPTVCDFSHHSICMIATIVDRHHNGQIDNRYVGLIIQSIRQPSSWSIRQSFCGSCVDRVWMRLSTAAHYRHRGQFDN